MESIKIDGERLYKRLKEISSKDNSMSKMSDQIGKSRNYLVGLKHYTEIPATVYSLICRTFDLNCSEFLHREPVPDPVKPAAPKVPEGPALKCGYDVTLRVSPNKVFMALWFDGVEISHAYSRVKGNREVDLVQAISYASHMIYKNVEQTALEKGN